MELNFGITFENLYRREGLMALDSVFVEQLKQADIALFNRFVAARANPGALSNKDASQLLMEVAPHAEDFIGALFGISEELRGLAKMHHTLAPIYSCKRLFVQRRAAKQVKPEEVTGLDWQSMEQTLAEYCAEPLTELSFATHVLAWMEKEEDYKPQLEAATRYAAWALFAEAGKLRHMQGVLFKLPHKIDPMHLVPVETELRDGITVLKLPHMLQRQREGFALTDDGGTLKQALDHAHYCIYCHHQGKDSCSRGMKDKDGSFKKSAGNVTLNGCPLEEKISEMNELKANGVPLGALAMAVIDNPMLAGTGHRICNDCMKSCIYQKQEPVNIPLVETRTLKDVLELPYGFEIYSLLTRWNPLNLVRPIPKAETDYKVLVAGLGPAGYTLAHHLMNDGHTVVGIDGLKIEPLPQEISGVTALGKRVPFKPIKNVKELYEALDERTLAGFGGVAEYGITVRWDKNYLKIIRLLLERREPFAMFGGVRFGGSITIEDAWAMGFDHIALCMGAGKPTMLEIKNGLARGVRAASDFLMALQLTGAAKKDSIANLQLRMPAVVVGGGLTAIDTATEALAYYPVQVEKFLSRYEALVAQFGVEYVHAMWNEEETAIAGEFIAHAQAIRGAKDFAQRFGQRFDLKKLLDGWGGVTIAYRRQLTDAPSYRLNHEEVHKALEEGIGFTEGWEPQRVNVDRYGHAESVTMKNAAGEEKIFPARSVLIAAGTSPNTVLAREERGIEVHGRYFRAVNEHGQPVVPEPVAKPTVPQMLTAIEPDGRAISFFGDLHPSFAGNVVKAMGSAKQGYPLVTKMLEKKSPEFRVQSSEFFERLNSLLRPVVHEVRRLTPTIMEVVLKAPQAAEKFQPGQFYRLQNYEAHAIRHNGTTLAMEGLAMTGAWVDKERGLISTIVLEMGGSSDLCAYLQPGEPVVLMGPTGTPTEIPRNQTVVLVGGGLGNAVLFSIGKALREAGSRVLYFAGYKKLEDRYKVEEIEAAADAVVWCCDEYPGFVPARPQDKSFTGNIVEAMEAYASGQLGEMPIAFSDADRFIVIGSDRMMAAVAAARQKQLLAYIRPEAVLVGSINSPMQCMMKEICAQCLQLHVDPDTGKESYVFSCFNQDQDLMQVSFPHLRERLAQNGLQEKLTALWIDHCLKALQLRQEAA